MSQPDAVYRHPSDTEWYPWLGSFLEKEGALGRERPLSVIWEITNLCNLRCRQCMTIAIEHDEDHPKIPPNELSTAEGYDLIDLWVKMGIPMLTLSGGEPLLREDFFELVGYAAKRFQTLTVESNGTLISEKVAQHMAENGIDEVVIGIDGACAETHEAIRGQDSYSRAVAGIQAAQRAGLGVTVVTTPMKLNAPEIGNILPALFEAGISPQRIRHSLTTYVPIGRALTESLEPSRDEYAAFCEAWCDMGRTVWAGTAVPRWIPREETELRCAFALHGCTAGQHAVVNSEGDVYPCAYLGRASVDYILGNVREDDFRELWHTNPMLARVQNFKSNLTGACGHCSARETCGGCRARAILAGRALEATDPWADSGFCALLQTGHPTGFARC